MPMCKNCNEVVGAGQLNEQGICEKCLSTDEGKVKAKEIKEKVESKKDKSGSGMKVFLYILATLAFIDGVIMLSQAQSAIHQILGYMAILVGAVFLSGGGIISAIASANNKG